MRSLFLILFVLTTSSTFAADTLRELYAACQGSPGSQYDLICGSYFNGFMDGVLGDQVSKEQGLPVCIPDGTTTAQIRGVVKGYLASHPEVLNLKIDTGGTVAAILAHQYPCQ